MIKKLLALAQMGRINMAPLTMSVPVLGALTGENPPDLLRLMLVGLLAHLFGFGLNDLIDLPLDRQVRPHHPLITGKLHRYEVWLFVMVLPLLALLLYPGRWVALLLMSLLLSIIYNLWSKWGRLPRLLAEIALASSVGLLCLSGVSDLTFEAILFSITLALVLLLINSVPSGLKDLKTDASYGARSFVLAMGCGMVDEERVHISRRLKIYALLLNGLIIAGISGLLSLYQPITLPLSLIFLMYGTLHLRLILNTATFTAIRQSMPLLNGYYTYTALALVLIARMPLLLQMAYGWLALLLLLVPVQVGWRVWQRRYHWA